MKLKNLSVSSHMFCRDLEVEGVDLNTDVSGNETRSIDRALKLINAIQSIELRTDVINWIGPEVCERVRVRVLVYVCMHVCM